MLTERGGTWRGGISSRDEVCDEWSVGYERIKCKRR